MEFNSAGDFCLMISLWLALVMSCLATEARSRYPWSFERSVGGRKLLAANAYYQGFRSSSLNF